MSLDKIINLVTGLVDLESEKMELVREEAIKQAGKNERDYFRKILKEIAEEDAAKDEEAKEPEFKIDGCGFYETRDGRIVCIFDKNSNSEYLWIGYYINSLRQFCQTCWKNNGLYSGYDKRSTDIVKKLTPKEA